MAAHSTIGGIAYLLDNSLDSISLDSIGSSAVQATGHRYLVWLVGEPEAGPHQTRHVRQQIRYWLPVGQVTPDSPHPDMYQAFFS